jgi:hypothetical protein
MLTNPFLLQHCLEKWMESDQRRNTSICTYGCADLKMTCRPRSDLAKPLPGKRRIDAPYIRLFLNEAGGSDAPSSDAVDGFEASQLQSQFLMRAARPPRDVVDGLDGADEEEEEDDGAMIGEDEVARLRRERGEALNKVRDMRDELAELRNEHEGLRTQARALEAIVVEREASIAALHDNLEDADELQLENQTLREKLKERKKKLKDLDLRETVLHEANLKLEEERDQLRKQLAVSGSSGEVRIGELEAEIKSQEHELLLFVLFSYLPASLPLTPFLTSANKSTSIGLRSSATTARSSRTRLSVQPSTRRSGCKSSSLRSVSATSERWKTSERGWTRRWSRLRGG